MNGTDDARGIATADDLLRDFLTGPPPPRSNVSERDVDTALAQLVAAAKVATRPAADGRRWVPGLSIVVVGGAPGHHAIRHCEGYGTKDVRTAAPAARVGPDTLFPCASLSKPVSVSLLVGAGVGSKPGWLDVVHPDETQTCHLDRSPRVQTLREWLSHRSGMPDHGGDLIEDMNPAMPGAEVRRRIMRHQSVLPPGEYRYTNFGFTMGCLGALNDAGHGADWQAFTASRLNALGMSRSTYSFTSAYEDTAADRVLPHQGQPGPAELEKLDTTGWAWNVVDQAHERNPLAQAPAGSLLSCAHDLGVFLQAHLNGGFGADYPPRNPCPEDMTGGRYSLGWNIGHRSGDKAFAGACNAFSFSHSGAFRMGAGTCLRFDPDAGYGIAILSNGEPTGVPEALSQLFFKCLYGQPLPSGTNPEMLFAVCRSLYLQQLCARKIENYKRYSGKTGPVPAGLPRGIIFRGHSDYYGTDIVLDHQGPELLLKMGTGPAGWPFWQRPLQSLEGSSSTFVYDTVGENEVGPSAVHLTWEDGVVVTIVDDWLDGSGPGLGEIARDR